MREQSIARRYADTGHQVATAALVGVGQPAVSKALSRPEVQAEVLRIQTERLFDELLPAAVNCLAEIVASPKAPAGARVQAAKLILDRTLGLQGSGDDKQAHEMTGEELANAIARLEGMAAERARPIEPSDGGIFD